MPWALVPIFPLLHAAGGVKRVLLMSAGARGLGSWNSVNRPGLSL